MTTGELLSNIGKLGGYILLLPTGGAVLKMPHAVKPEIVQQFSKVLAFHRDAIIKQLKESKWGRLP